MCHVIVLKVARKPWKILVEEKWKCSPMAGFICVNCVPGKISWVREYAVTTNNQHPISRKLHAGTGNNEGVLL